MRITATKNLHLVGLFCLLVMPFLITYHPEILPIAPMVAATLIGLIIMCVMVSIYSVDIKANPLTILLGVIFILLLMVSFFNSTEVISRTRLFVYGLAVVTASLIGFNIDKKYCAIEGILKLVMWGGVLIALISFIIFYASSVFGLDNIISHNHVRMSGPIAQANLLAISLFVAMGATLQLLIDNKIKKISAYVILFILGYVFFGTLSRALLLGFILFYGLILYLHDSLARKQLFLAGVMIVMASLLFLLCNDALMSYTQTHSWIPVQDVENKYFDRSMLGFRLSEWHKAWILFLDHPLFGVGFDKYGAASVSLNHLPWAVVENSFPAHSHNIFFQLIAEFGVVGMLVAIALFIYSLRYIVRTKHYKLFILALFFPFFVNTNVEFVLWRVSFAAFIVFLLSYFDSSVGKYEFKDGFKKLYLGVVSCFLTLLILISIPAYQEVLRIMNGGRINVEKLYEYSAHPVYGSNFSYAFVRVASLDGFLENEHGYSLFSHELGKQLRLTPDPIIRFKAMQKAIYDEDRTALNEHYQYMESMFKTDKAMLDFFANECKANQSLCNKAYAYVVNNAQDD